MGGRSSGASGWSVASDSQLSVDAPADHGGDSPPVSLRGGEAMGERRIVVLGGLGRLMAPPYFSRIWLMVWILVW